MVEPVLETFEQILALWHATRCDKCGRPTGDPMPVIRVGQLVLDRAGFHPTLNVEREPAPLNKFAGLTPDELVAKVEAMLEHALALRDRSRQRFAIDATSDEPGADSEVDDASKGDT